MAGSDTIYWFDDFAVLTHATRINQSSTVTFLMIHPFDIKRATTNIDAVDKTAIVTPRVSGARDSPILLAVDQYLRVRPTIDDEPHDVTNIRDRYRASLIILEHMSE